MKRVGRRSRAGFVIVAIVVAALVVGAVVLRRGQHADNGNFVAAINQARYCQLASQFEAASLSTTAASAPGKFDGSVAAIGSLLDTMGPALDELAKDAPDQIRADVTAVVSGLRAAHDGRPESTSSPAFTAAAQQMADYQSHCALGSGSGE